MKKIERKALYILWIGVLDCRHGMEYWSGLLEWKLGGNFLSGTENSIPVVIFNSLKKSLKLIDMFREKSSPKIQSNSKIFGFTISLVTIN